MLGFLRGLFGDKTRIPPLMVRALGGAGAPREVSIEAVWFPSGLKRAYRAKDAQGLCMLPWVSRAQQVSLRVRAEGAEAVVVVDREDAKTGRAIELELA